MLYVCGDSSEGHCNKADNNAISLLPFLGFGMQFELKIRKMHALFFPFFLPKADWVKGEQYQVYTYKGNIDINAYFG